MEARVIATCELHVDAEKKKKTDPVEEHQVVLTAEPGLQPYL